MSNETTAPIIMTIDASKHVEWHKETFSKKFRALFFQWMSNHNRYAHITEFMDAVITMEAESDVDSIIVSKVPDDEHQKRVDVPVIDYGQLKRSGVPRDKVDSTSSKNTWNPPDFDRDDS